VAVDLQLVDNTDLVEADDPPKSPQTLRREPPVDEVIARYTSPDKNNRRQPLEE
jgi:hypothetical protein